MRSEYTACLLMCIYSLYSKLTMEVILSTAFGRSVDVQGGKGGDIYEAACGVLDSFANRSLQLRIAQFVTCKKLHGTQIVVEFNNRV